MNKFVLFIVMIVAMVGLVFADYAATDPGDLSLPEPALVTPVLSTDEVAAPEVQPVASIVPSNTRFTQEFLATSPELSTLKLQDTVLTQELFERFDIAQIGLEVYKTSLLSSDGSTLIIYELPGALGQGRFNFLSLKLAITTRLASDEPINQNDVYGQASLFYNDVAQDETGFLLVQVRDNVYGFMYPKASSSIFDWIQAVILTLNNS